MDKQPPKTPPTPTPPSPEATKIAELESEIALLKQEAEAKRIEREALEKDNATLLAVNKRLQLAVGVQQGDDALAEPEKEKTKTPDELQNELVEKFIKYKKER